MSRHILWPLSLCAIHIRPPNLAKLQLILQNCTAKIVIAAIARSFINLCSALLEAAEQNWTGQIPHKAMAGIQPVQAILHERTHRAAPISAHISSNRPLNPWTSNRICRVPPLTVPLYVCGRKPPSARLGWLLKAFVHVKTDELAVFPS